MIKSYTFSSIRYLRLFKSSSSSSTQISPSKCIYISSNSCCNYSSGSIKSKSSTMMNNDIEYQFPVDKLDTDWVSSPKQPVVLLGCGSFNPITFMHLRMFEICRDYCNLQFNDDNEDGYNVIGGYLSPVGDAYKKPTLIPAKYRLDMVRLALGSSSWLMMDDWESRNQQFTPTRQVLDHVELCVNNHFKSVLGESYRYVQIKLICGADLLSSFNIPKLWADSDMEMITSKKYGILCIERPGSDIQEIIVKNNILTTNNQNIKSIPPGITNDLSSTKLREYIGKGISIKYLTIDSVIDYIGKFNLYKK